MNMTFLQSNSTVFVHGFYPIIVAGSLGLYFFVDLILNILDMRIGIHVQLTVFGMF